MLLDAGADPTLDVIWNEVCWIYVLCLSFGSLCLSVFLLSFHDYACLRTTSHPNPFINHASTMAVPNLIAGAVVVRRGSYARNESAADFSLADQSTPRAARARTGLDGTNALLFLDFFHNLNLPIAVPLVFKVLIF
jgi:hypothetical protein